MKYFKKTSVATVLTLLIIALCCVLGYVRAAPGQPSPEDAADIELRRAGEGNMNYYLGWLDDGARLFSLDTLDTLAHYNLDLDNKYGSLVAIKTVWHLSGMEIDAYAQNTADHLNLGSRDILLLLDTNTKDWYVTYGGGVRSYVEEDDSLAKLFDQHLSKGFFEENTDRDQEILALLGNMTAWYEEHVPPVDNPGDPIFHLDGKRGGASVSGIIKGILFTLAANIWWIILLFLVLYVLDSVRFTRYYARRTQGEHPNERFRPFLFWHAAGSQWYRQMTQRAKDGDLNEEGGDFFFGSRKDPLGPDGPTAGAGGEGYAHGPGYSTDPNEPGPSPPNTAPTPMNRVLSVPVPAND